MSNVIIGGVLADGSAWSSYETNGCGMGARPNSNGLDGIQCHMTNTLNTPIETLERLYPIRVTRYEFAEGTGGAGEFRGGNGLVRSFQLLSGPGTISLLADRQTLAPQGLRGGADGISGSHTLVRNGTATKLPGKTTIALEAGDEVIVQTPGGGGYGRKR